MKTGRIIAGCLGAMLLASSASASLLTWTITGGKFDDGRTFNGSFTYDVDSDYISDWDVTSSAHGPVGAHFVAGGFGSGASTDLSDPGALSFTVSDFDFFVFSWVDALAFTNLVYSVPGTVTLAGMESYTDCPNWTDCTTVSRRIVGGIATTENVSSVVPEPASWAMMVGGFGLIGYAMRSRRKLAVSFT